MASIYFYFSEYELHRRQFRGNSVLVCADGVHRQHPRIIRQHRYTGSLGSRDFAVNEDFLQAFCTAGQAHFIAMHPAAQPHWPGSSDGKSIFCIDNFFRWAADHLQPQLGQHHFAGAGKLHRFQLALLSDPQHSVAALNGHAAGKLRPGRGFLRKQQVFCHGDVAVFRLTDAILLQKGI